MGYRIIQTTAKVKGTAGPTLTSSASDWTNNVTPHSSIIVVAWSNASPVTVISDCMDSDGNTYTLDKTQSQSVGGEGQYVVSIFHFHNVTGGNKPTFTVTSTSGARVVFAAIEVEGLQQSGSPVVNGNGSSSSTTTPSAGQINGTGAHALVVALVALSVSTTNSFSAEPAGLTSQVQETSNVSPAVPGDGAAAFFDQGVNFNPTWTIGTSSPFAAAVAAFAAIPDLSGPRLMIGGSVPYGIVWKRPIGVAA